jgi:hypothetical protein
VICHLTREKGENKMATITNSNQPVISLNQGLGPKTTIINLAKTNMTNANVATVLQDIQFDGFTIAGVTTADGSAFVSGTTDNIQIAVQGSTAIAAESDPAHGLSGGVTTVLATF